MKAIFTSAMILLLFFANVFGQKTEFRGSLNSGVFSYKRITPNDPPSFYYEASSNSAFTYNNSGINSGVCFGFSFNFKRIAKSDHFWGLDLGYEMLRSTAPISKFYTYTQTSSNSFITTGTSSATGEIVYNNSFIVLNPYIGHRYRLKQVNFDLAVGVDVAYCLKAKEKGNATTPDGSQYSVSGGTSMKARPNINPRVQLQIGYKRIGVYGGYSAGLTNLIKKKWGFKNGYSNIIRFGATYNL